MTLTIEDEILYYRWGWVEENKEVYGYWISIDIKYIKEIEIKKDYFDSNDKIGWSKIYLYFDKNKAFIKDLDDHEEYQISDSTFIDILLDAKFIDDDMAPRMQKALLHLVKLNGGSAKIKKEPF